MGKPPMNHSCLIPSESVVDFGVGGYQRKTNSGLNIRGWVRRVITVNQVCGRDNGPAFCDDQGVALRSRDMNEVLHELLGEIFVEHSALFQPVRHSSVNGCHQRQVFGISLVSMRIRLTGRCHEGPDGRHQSSEPVVEERGIWDEQAVHGDDSVLC
jgi:hypothetical protein